MAIIGIDGIVLLYVGVNIAAAAAFWWDKHKARRDERRTRESVLLLLAFLGPFGAYAAMRQFRHKTQKTKFLLVPAFCLLHGALIIWLIMGFMK